MPAWLPIGRYHDLASYAKSRVMYASAYACSEGPLVPGGVSGVWATTNNPDIRVITKLLSDQMLDFEVVYPEERMYSGAYLMDEMYNVLYWGQNSFYLIPPKWTLPVGADDVGMALNSSIFIAIPGAWGATSYVMDTNGYYTYYSIYGNGSGVYFPTFLAGISASNWTGCLTIWGSSNVVYDMTTGSQKSGTEVQMAVKTAIDRLVTLDDPVYVYDNPVSENGQGKRSWYQIKVTEHRIVKFYGVTTEGEVAKEVVIRPAYENAESHGYWIVKGAWTPVEMDEGVYDVWFNYPTFDPDMPMWPWWWSEGKG
jgi:hypothetical protein